MALATRCPHCNTTFRVAADQLKLRGGVVRCGSCNEVFDGNAALVEPQVPSLELVREAEPEVAPLPIEVQPAPQEFPQEDFQLDQSMPFPSRNDGFSDNDVVGANETTGLVDITAAVDPQPEVPRLSEPEPSPEPEPLPEPEPAPAPTAAPAPPAPTVANNLNTGPLPLLRQASITPYDVPAPATSLQPLKPVKSGKTSALSKLKSAKPAKPARPAPPPPPPEPDPEPDEPQFVKQSRELERTGRTRNIAMIAGTVALTLALLVQGITTFRNVLVARFPGMNPAIASACAALGCRVELPSQIEALSIETGELQTLAPNTFSLITQLRNQSELSQAWPHIELELTDATDKALVRRVFTPAEYLPPGTPATRGFGARSEQSVKLYFELKQLKASGYHIAVFYP